GIYIPLGISLKDQKTAQKMLADLSVVGAYLKKQQENEKAQSPYYRSFGLGGDSFIVQGESYLKSQMRICNNTAGCSASMNTSYFQMPVEFGFRSNFSKHSGIEVGFKLPLFTNQFYKERGVDGSVDVFYKRNFSIYFNYMINF
ncbi:outer membrane protein, partial [Helicobacter pylori]|uniref:outer membrane protein n=1 Tax=Helicobacter pylori TaxID=210 RepID=UPI00217D1AE6